MRNIPPRGSSTALGMTRVCLAKALYFACLFRHATSDSLLCWFIAECSFCVGADAKTRITITVTSPLPTLPEVRPALIGTAPNSLINTIDTAELIKNGQKEAAVMFSCLVAPTGQVVNSGAYRGTRGSELLEQELLKRLATAKFIPAVHNHQPVIAVFYGTVKFAVANGKPRLRIFANQQLNEVDKETDYIDPQPYVGQDSKFAGLHYPDTGSTVAVTGVVDLALNVDAKGNLTNLQVLSEVPPLLGFGDAALTDFDGAKFIPAFRNGQPVESNVKIPIYYKPSS